MPYSSSSSSSAFSSFLEPVATSGGMIGTESLPRQGLASAMLGNIAQNRLGGMQDRTEQAVLAIVLSYMQYESTTTVGDEEHILGIGIDPEQHIPLGGAAADTSIDPVAQTGVHTNSHDNTIATARNLGSLESVQTFRDSIGPSDPNDFYEFTLDQAGDFSLTFSSDDDWANVRLLDQAGNSITGTYSTLYRSAQINRYLGAGTYYVQVDDWADNYTGYTLDLSAVIDHSDTTPDDNTLVTARNLGSLEDVQSFRDFIGPSDPDDFYQFTLDQAGDFSLTLDSDNDWANVRLLDADGNNITSTYSTLYRSAQINRYLGAGTYYVQVDDWADNYSSYTLDLSAALDSSNTAIDDNTLATARNIGSVENEQSFRNFIGPSDPNDFYQFHLDQASDFSLTLDSDNDWANVRLLDADGNNITSTYSTLYRSAQINRYLGAGIYYVQVDDWYNDYTSYTLNLSANIDWSDGAGNTFGSARNLGLLNGIQQFDDFVGPSDAIDYYRFELDQGSDFSLSMTGLSDDIDVELLDSGGNRLAVSEFSDTQDETIQSWLNSGTYYVKVYPYSDLSSDYQLHLCAEPASAPYSSVYGHGLVDANAALAYVLGQTPAQDVPDFGSYNWGLDAIQAPEVWNQGYTGEGVVIAVLDTGVDYRHSDLDDNIWRNNDEIFGNGIDDDGNGFIDDVIGWDFADGDYAPMDSVWDSHGTHVAGIIAAENGGFSTTGVAYNAEIMPIRVMSNDGTGSYADITSGIYYAVDNGAHIINMSLSGAVPDQALEAAIQYAHSHGVFMVFAAGNDGSTLPQYPAHYATDYGLTVGSINESGNLSYFSNRPDDRPELNFVVAPGSSIYSTESYEWTGYQSGTSMAAPMVAGTAALLLSADPTLTPDELRTALTETAVPLA